MGQAQDGKKKKASTQKILNMASTNNNPSEGQEVCFEVNSAFGVNEIVKKGSNLYKVNWNYAGLKAYNGWWST
eukprot:11283231-Ditylum_brightwellii.AAC.1